MRKVWIDAGHGGKDPGAAANELQEKDIALRVSLGIKKRLEASYKDVQVLLSRSTDVFLELKERTNKANAAGVDLLVSVHCNAGGGKGGFESFRYTSASQNSIKLQGELHKAIMNKIGGIDRGKKAQNLHMVRESKMPAVLTENLFVDVAGDAMLLKQTMVIDAIIDGHVEGIAQYLGLAKKEEETLEKVNVILYGKPITDVKLINGTTYVALRDVGKALGATVEWDGRTNTATVTK